VDQPYGGACLAPGLAACCLYHSARHLASWPAPVLELKAQRSIYWSGVLTFVWMILAGRALAPRMEGSRASRQGERSKAVGSPDAESAAAGRRDIRLSTQPSEKRALDRVEVSVLCTGVGRGRASVSRESEAPRKRANLQRYARHRSGERRSAFVVAAAGAGAARDQEAWGRSGP
jgi:hypothetical protein